MSTSWLTSGFSHQQLINLKLKYNKKFMIIFFFSLNMFEIRPTETNGFSKGIFFIFKAKELIIGLLVNSKICSSPFVISEFSYCFRFDRRNRKI